jgi:rhodanese-related sulfurtransferase
MQQVQVRALSALLKQWPGPRPPVLLDVREPWEVALARLDLDGTPTVCIPMAEIVARVAELDPEVPVFALCHHGMRSQQVATFLEHQGYTSFNVSGGIDAWSLEVDARVPRY